MRKWAELKTWERQYLKKRMILWGILGLLLFAAVAAGYLVVRKHSASVPEASSSQQGERASQAPQAPYFWEDTFTGQPFKLLDNKVEETALSEEISLLWVNVEYKNGMREKREMVWLKEREPDTYYNLVHEGNCQYGAKLTRRETDEQGVESIKTDFIILYCGNFGDNECVFCAVSTAPEVYDTAGSDVIRVKHDGLYYSYFYTKECKPGYDIHYEDLAIHYEDMALEVYGIPERSYQSFVEWVTDYRSERA